MFNEIRRIFRKSVDAFREELGKREPEDQVADLLAAMRREMVAARAAIPEFEEEVTRAREELRREIEAVELCERRGAMADRIGDAETARVAREFAQKHRQRAQVLEQKVATAAADLELHRNEVEEMKLRYREAESNRFALLAQLRRTAGAERMRAAASDQSGPFADFGRMEEKVERDSSVLDALDEMDDSPPPPRPDPTAVEDRLRELKRRMGKE